MNVKSSPWQKGRASMRMEENRMLAMGPAI